MQNVGCFCWFVFKCSQTCYAVSHVLSVQLCLACVRLTPYERVDAAGATLFPLHTPAQGQEMSSNPRHLRLTAFMSGFGILLGLRSTRTTMFNVRWERMWFEFGCGRSLLLWIELKFLHIWWSRAAELVWTGADYTAQLSDLVERTPWAMWDKLHIY